MPYIPHTADDEAAMLKTIGVNSIDDLFVEIPEDLRVRKPLNIADAMDERKLYQHLFNLASQNQSAAKLDWYLGAGLYDRYVPASVGAIISRGEFLTAYTPYQPEMSQGYLQTIYEFQTMVAELYGMDVANASMYDGATSMAEAAIMATSVTGRSKVFVAQAVHPNYREVLGTYSWAQGLDVTVGQHEQGATTDYSALTDEFACVIVQTPNFYGVLEDLQAARDAANQVGAMLVVVADPVACALIQPPGAFDADIVVGEGQPLGVAMGFGGPLLGLFATKDAYVRRIPGRIVGRTQDVDGKPGFTMTLRTREQDIRREKATSNICTNEALMALAATVYMSALGKNGMQSIAESSVRNTQYAISELAKHGIKPAFPGKVFGEVTLNLGTDATVVRDRLIEQGIMAGLPLGNYEGHSPNWLLSAFTENRTKEQIDRLVAALAAR